MKNYILKIGFASLIGLFSLQMNGQEKKIENQSKKEIKTEKTAISNKKKAQKAELKAEKSLRLDEDTKMKRSKASNNKGKAYGKNKLGLEGREFGQYRAWQARNKKNSDKNWSILDHNISNKIDNYDESIRIIKLKRAELEKEYKNNKISKSEFDELYQELDYATEDVEKIKVWVGGPK